MINLQKTEPRDIQNTEAFHSAESSSSRDSNPNSPQSMDSVESHHQQMQTSYYDPAAHYRMQNPNAMMQHSNQFNPLTPPNFDTPKLDRLIAYHHHLSTAAANYNTQYQTPLQVPTPPKSPNRIHPETPELTTNDNSCGESEHSDDGPKDEGDNKHINYDSGEDNDDLLSTPRINSHGKMKTFKCKQCDYIAVTKTDFWKHIEQHIKPEKRLYCPKCPFVTEYKHHQEYHLRNHSGSKPFQCNKCRYSCVNKSMLNSHKKSHSNVYQYRCADCNYVSKYCHSLKLHLKKYKHQPAMVLNQDGTPNPLQIIDVYGTRRGPKARPTSSRDDIPQQMPSQTTPVSRLQHMQQEEQQSLANVQQQMFSNPFAGIPFPYGPLLTAFPGFQNLMFNNNNIEPLLSSEKSDQQSADMQPKENQDHQAPTKTPENEQFQTQLVQPPQKTPTDSIFEGPVDMSPKRMTVTPIISSPVSASAESALDLTRTTKEDRPSSNNSTSKNRRKGKAFKLDRLATQTQYSSEDDESSSVTQSPVKVKTEEEQTRSDIEAPMTKSPEVFECRYCEMVFKHEVLYTMHMGYHGYKDAFACNMCGERCGDRVSFFMHIARNPHV